MHVVYQKRKDIKGNAYIWAMYLLVDTIFKGVRHIPGVYALRIVADYKDTELGVITISLIFNFELSNDCI